MKDTVVDITDYKYDQTEKDLKTKLVKYSERPEIQSQIGEAFYIWKDDPDFLASEVTEDRIDDVTFEKFFDWFLYDFKLLDTQERVIERFYKAERNSLSEIEETVIKGWLDSFYSYFEVEEVTPGESCRIRDLFTQNIYTVRDALASGKIKRSDIIGARPLSTENNHYFSGLISAYPSAFKSVIIDFINSEFKEYKKSFGREKPIVDYLRDWGYRTGHYLEDMAKNPQFVTPEGDEFVLASAIYGITNRGEVIKQLGKIKAVKELSGENDEIKVFNWEKTGKNKITATIEIENDRLKIECYSINMLDRTKAKLEEAMGDSVTHLEDVSRELNSFIDVAGKEKHKVDKLPPGTKSRKEMDTTLEDYYTSWIDEPHPNLGGKTPREATNTPEDRKSLIQVLNDLEAIYDGARKRGEPYYDVEKIKKKLELI